MIDAANAAMVARDQEIQAQKTTIDDLTKELVMTQQSLNDDTSALHAWYHNPFILTGLGVIIGGLTVGYLKK